jgi:hypothetical protein
MKTANTSFPDTLFLPDRAKLAINCLTGLLNPTKDYLPYCLVDLTGQPPKMAHTQFDYSDHTARVIDALLLAKTMTGSEEGEDALAKLNELFDSGFASDGLHYTPENQWSFRHANMHYQRSVINALLALRLARGSEAAGERLNGLVDGLHEISIKREGFAYFPSVERLPEGWPRGDWNILSWGVDPANTNGRLLFGLTRTAEILKSGTALDLAGLYANHVMDHSSAFGSDGSFATGMEFREGHFHSRAVTLLGVIRYGYGANNARAIEWGRRVFDKARTYGTTFGWFPERLVRTRAHGCETCAIVDMMESAIWLAKSGHTDYWEVAERYLRNHLVESQLVNVDGLEGGNGEDGWETTRDVARRALGGFAGWSQPNDLVSKRMHSYDLYMCCCAQGVRGLFNAWTNSVSTREDLIRVNLLINHAGEAATVKSWQPHAGKIEVTAHQAGEVRIRLPSFIEVRDVTLTVDGRSVPVSMPEPNFVSAGRVVAGAVVEMNFPLARRTTHETVLDTTYAVDWRGDTVVGISPGGGSFPLYQRSVLAPDTVPLVDKSVPLIPFHL